MKKFVRTAIVGLASGAALVATATPAAATTKCTSVIGTSQVQACVIVGGSTYGTLTSYTSYGFYNYLIAVEECRTDMTNCIQFVAMSSSGWAPSDATNAKPCAFGHVYRTRASWNDGWSGDRYADVRTNWTAC